VPSFSHSWTRSFPPRRDVGYFVERRIAVDDSGHCDENGIFHSDRTSGHELPAMVVRVVDHQQHRHSALHD
jgi:hypothetical protein